MMRQFFTTRNVLLLTAPDQVQEAMKALTNGTLYKKTSGESYNVLYNRKPDKHTHVLEVEDKHGAKGMVTIDPDDSFSRYLTLSSNKVCFPSPYAIASARKGPSHHMIAAYEDPKTGSLDIFLMDENMLAFATNQTTPVVTSSAEQQPSRTSAGQYRTPSNSLQAAL
jgi:hypothetical protein